MINTYNRIKVIILTTTNYVFKDHICLELKKMNRLISIYIIKIDFDL